MTERELTLFSAMTDIGDDLVLESGAFLPALKGPAALGVTLGGHDDGPAKEKKKRAPWFIPTTVAACVATVTAVGILVGVIGQSLGFFPIKPPEDTTVESETSTEEPSETVDESGVDTGEGESESSSDPVVEEKDYGLPFTALYCSDTFDKGYYFDRADGSAYALSEAVYQRIRHTEEYLGVEISAVDGGNQDTYYASFISSANAGKDDYQWILTHGHRGVVSLMTSFYLMDLKEAQGLNLGAAHWDPDQNEKLTVSGKQLIAYNNFLLPDGYVLAFDRDMVSGKLDVDELYQLVESKGWTLEALESYVTAFGDGSGERYGMSCAGEMPLAAFVTSSDIQVLDHSGKRITLTAMEKSGRGATVDALLYGLSESWEIYAYDPEKGHMPIRLGAGQVAFEAVTLSEVIRMGGDVDVGILPYPLFDRNQESYRTLYVGGYMAVPCTVKHQDMVWDVLEVLAKESAPVREAYLDAVLTGGGCTSVKDRAMLTLVADSMTVEQGLALMDVHSRMEAIMMAIPRHLEGDGAYGTNVPYLWSQASKKIDDLVRAVGTLPGS